MVTFGEDIASSRGVRSRPRRVSSQRLGPGIGCGTRRSRRPGFLGAAVGAAATGLRPVVEIMFIESWGGAGPGRHRGGDDALSLGRQVLGAFVVRASRRRSGLGSGVSTRRRSSAGCSDTRPQAGGRLRSARGPRTAIVKGGHSRRRRRGAGTAEDLTGRREEIESNDERPSSLSVLRRSSRTGSDVTVVRSRPDGGEHTGDCRSGRVRMVGRGHRSPHTHAVGQGNRHEVRRKDGKVGDRRGEPAHRGMGEPRSCRSLRVPAVRRI